MRGLAKILSVLVLCTGIMPIPNRAAGSEAEAFEKLNVFRLLAGKLE